MTDYRQTPEQQGAQQPVALAVALERRSGHSLPIITASGRGALAEEILSLAFAHNVKVRPDADLAQLLSSLDIDTPIPPEAIMVVAEILTRVYAANAALATHSVKEGT